MNPNIPLAAVQPQQSPIQTVEGALTLRTLLENQQYQREAHAQALQENQLQIQQSQRALNADQALSSALSAATTQGPDGKYTIDYDAAGNELAKQGYGKQYLAFDTDRRANLKAAADLKTAQLTQQAAAGTQLAGIIDSIKPYPSFPTKDALAQSPAPAQPGVDQPATGQPTTSPQQPGLDDLNAYRSSVQDAAQEAMRRGIIDDSHLAWIQQNLKNPTPEFDAQLRQYGKMGLSHAEQMTDARNKVADLINNHLHEAEGAQKSTEAINAEVSSFAQTAPTNPADWEQQRAQLSPAARARIPAEYSPEALKQVRRYAVPVEKQPEFDIQSKTAEQMANMTSGDWQREVNNASGGNVPLAQRTQGLVDFAVKRGDYKAAQAAIKDASDQIGRTETAVATAKATVPVKINLAGAEEQAKLQGQSQLTPQGEKMAQEIANYQQAPLTGFALRSGQGQAIMARAGDINPDYHSEYYQTFQKTENDATTGTIGKKANSLNTMMGHLSVLNDAADAMKNGNIPALNKLANLWGVQTGQTPVTTYKAIVHRLAPEITTAYVTSGGTQGERGTNEADFDPSLGANQIKANVGVSAQLADSKIKALQDQYNRGTYGRGKQKLISDEAEQARQRLATQSPVSAPLQIGQPVTLKNGNRVTVTAVHPDGSFDAK